MVETGEEVQNSTYRINESWRWNVHGWNTSNNNALSSYDD